MKTNDKTIKIIIVGAGKAGALLAEDINNNDDISFSVIGFVDDDTNKKNKIVNGVRVLGDTDKVSDIIQTTGAEEVWFAIPSARASSIRKIVSKNLDKRIIYRILPRSYEVLEQPFEEDYLKYIRKVSAVDLVGGEINKKDQDDIKNALNGLTVMITGAAGSIGSELSKQIALYGAKKIVFYDWWENGMFELRNQIVTTYPDGNFEFIIG
ncbi:MAG: hypothetical protein QG645_209, partial [Patescibacteria group bacterium]|nr:hypothetical protein [Patescibacteria group bacterium]